SAPKKVAKICFANDAVNSANIFLFHKTTQRKLYEQILSETTNADEVILWNEHDEVTEGCTT
ncbi:MAG: hypothetical protein GWO23_12295, partial [Gammaproteobacteria bacterium]|nr:hypothetical protein [Gammaproteobacteria bacterium]